ncbi:MAG: FecR domain-containing protein [Proteobacteria bacterium]|uniref:FecR family protein n=1 Tax=Rudaea sp. TaxID=2136325 RepID=UPI003782E167|nr:FecR domain-containing protein [Pseudomonadota bacterium]
MQTPSDPHIDERAADWVAREDRASLDPTEIVERDAWLRADARHFGAYARARAVYARTNRLAALSSSVRAPANHHGPRRPLRRLGLGVALAAGILVVAFGAYHATRSGTGYATHKGEVLRVPLSDGSTITLDSDSAVDVAYGTTRRGVRLLRGAAVFDVAKHHALPFIVEAHGTQVTAVGTSFQVSLANRGEDETDVLVREGIVDVAEIGAIAQPARLPANFRASARKGRAIEVEPLSQENVARRLAWRDGMLAFNGDTLQYAADEFARYSDTRIVIDQPTLAQRRVVGLYSANDPVGFAHSIAKSLDLIAEQRGDGVHLFEAMLSAKAIAPTSSRTGAEIQQER